MVTATKQDVQAIVDGARNRILGNMVTRQDLQAASDGARDRVLAFAQYLQQQNQQIMRQSAVQHTQLTKRLIGTEARLISLENELKTLHQLIARLVEHQALPMATGATKMNGDTVLKEQYSRPQQYVYGAA